AGQLDWREADVQDRVPPGVALPLLAEGGLRRLASDGQVDDLAAPPLAVEQVGELATVEGERDGAFPALVEHARDQPPPAQAPGGRASELGPLGGGELDMRHGRSLLRVGAATECSVRPWRLRGRQRRAPAGCGTRRSASSRRSFASTPPTRPATSDRPRSSCADIWRRQGSSAGSTPASPSGRAWSHASPAGTPKPRASS